MGINNTVVDHLNGEITIIKQFATIIDGEYVEAKYYYLPFIAYSVGTYIFDDEILEITDEDLLEHCYSAYADYDE